MRRTFLSPVSPELPLLTASALAAPSTLCGVWLASAPALQPMPLRLLDNGAWRTLLIGSDLGRLLAAVDAALVDAGAGPVVVAAAALRRARHLDVDGDAPVLDGLRGSSPEACLARHPLPGRPSRIRYLG